MGWLKNSIGNWLGLDEDGNQQFETALNTNVQEAEKQRQFEFDMWNRSNEYNSPANQMQLYRDAGLNPSLLYGNPLDTTSDVPAGAEANSPSPSSGQLGSLSSSFLGLGQGVMNAMLLPAQADLLKAQAEKLRSEIPVNDQKVVESKERVSSIKTDIEQKKLQMKELGLEVSYKEQTLPSRVQAAIAKNNFDTQDRREAIKYISDIYEEQYYQLTLQSDELEEKVHNWRANTEVSKAKKAEILQGIVNMKQQYRSLRAQAEQDEYAAKNKEAGFWTSHITNAYQAGVYAATQVKELLNQLEESMKNFGSQWSSENETPIMPMYE